MARNPVIIPVAGGKGGVGKSLITASIAIMLAKRGHKTLAVDLDLGGSNLHSYLGLRNIHPGIGDYIRSPFSPLKDYIVPTELDNLGFIPGDGRTPFMADIPEDQKGRLKSDIYELDADYILLDLSAGSSFNNLDYFLSSDKGLLVTTTEYPAIMNMLVFLKNFWLRAAVHEAVKRGVPASDATEAIQKAQAAQASTSAPVWDCITDIPDSVLSDIRRACCRLRPRIVFNMGAGIEDLAVIDRIDEALQSNLDTTADYFGFVMEDKVARDAVKKGVPLGTHYTDSISAMCISRVADRITRIWERPLDNTAELLITDTKKLFEQMSVTKKPDSAASSGIFSRLLSIGKKETSGK